MILNLQDAENIFSLGMSSEDYLISQDRFMPIRNYEEGDEKPEWDDLDEEMEDDHTDEPEEHFSAEELGKRPIQDND